MKILVVCGAGASSTFVAQRLRHAAQRQGMDLLVEAGIPGMVATGVDAGDVVLVGPHLASALSDVEQDAAARRARVVLLPEDIFGDRDGTRALALVTAAAPDAAAPIERTPR
ncbi:PTS sugar transporter [Microbacterium sp. EYE_5]|uniref:PTS sugar transporter subunit IIB n=1 Tax=unclassified Microbacterium TaxID=2609290 RepID=UPI002003E481|nr:MULTISPECIES: PTS sugar transporter [unclassified Microbacterium]MCK6081552.1 PTS sugar transporter [Microbacterium sp. EYE_382]MCK6086822.1 PTS sugar transporter [Microbacterium sp. EYE_384]MCK6123680.1 PTS sugar transporter [Microbacterium sp. EYE_80]MCK6126589.1 PTS sugar transporter [Microbacterium sp. EYE_79]MCK6142506.1 PTS sugar transporter [Microbacterium sp. EYE_39]